MNTGQLRQSFLSFFHKRGHTLVPSSSLVPSNDPTLLFTNAGMVQFKDAFLGLEERPYTKAVSTQRCVRAGGKHNDLENVGYTARHHTFFEMLGNFSFGDYFKREAIQFAWEFLTQELAVPNNRLWVTVYEEDEETADIWLNHMKIDPQRFSRCGAKDNFWSMGDTGPCGPCTEIFYDHGPEIPGGPPGSKDEDGDRYIEIWNLVFMQFDRSEDGVLSRLPKPSVDTGMGLERMAAVMQGVHSNYDIDIFQHLIKAAAEITKTQDLHHQSLRVIADHIRSCAFLITDGVIPSNEGRGYVLRRICRRAIRHGYLLGVNKEPFFHQLVKPLVEVMGHAYPELGKAHELIDMVLEKEERQFAITLEQGLKILEEDLSKLSKGTVSEKVISGNTAFRLYDTYGFPLDLTADIARERGLTVDVDGFNLAMEEQRVRARGASQFSAYSAQAIEIQQETEFTGYEGLEQETTVEAIYRKDQQMDSLKSGEEGLVILKKSPFYAESGGQVGDRGWIRFKGGNFRVDDTSRIARAHAHKGVVLEGTLKVGDSVRGLVDPSTRQATALNHSATHLLHAALRKVLGDHVQQKGSLVAPDRLRFDFTHFEPLTPPQIKEVERVVNEQIRLNTEVFTELMTAEKAVEKGAMALFGEKYDKTKKLRVLRMGGDFSMELCGGTHVKRTGDIGLLKIVLETGISAGVRRVEAVTGAGALNWIENLETRLEKIASLLKSGRDAVEEKVEQTILRSRQLEKEVQQLKATLATGGGGVDLMQQAKDIKGVKVLAARLPVADTKTLRATVDDLKNKLKTAVVVLAGVEENRVNFVVGVTKDCTPKISANELVKYLGSMVGGKGGGRPDMAEGGGNNPEGLQHALESVDNWLVERL